MIFTTNQTKADNDNFKFELLLRRTIVDLEMRKTALDRKLESGYSELNRLNKEIEILRTDSESLELKLNAVRKHVKMAMKGIEAAASTPKVYFSDPHRRH